MSAGPDIHGMVNDQQFQSLPPRDQRRALYQLTNDQSFQGLSDADTMRFVGSMRATSTAATTTPPVPPAGSISATSPSDPVGSTLKFIKGFGQTAGTAALSPNTMGQGGLGQPIPEGTPDFSLADALKGHLSLSEMLAKLKGDVSTANPLKPLLDKPHDPEALGQTSANVAMLARGFGQGMETPADLTKKIPTGDLAAKGKAVSKLLGQEALAKVPIAGRVVRRPSFTDYAEALAQKADPQMELFKNVPKLGDFPATETPVNPPAEVAKTAPSVAPTKTDSGLPQRSNLPKNLRALANAPKTYNISPSQFLEKIGGAKNMNPESVAQAKAAWTKGEPVEPPTMTIDEQGNVLEADGRHRALGAVQAGLKSIPIRVIVKRAK